MRKNKNYPKQRQVASVYDFVQGLGFVYTWWVTKWSKTLDTTHRRDGGIRAVERTTTVAGAAGDQLRPDFLRR